MAAAFDNTGSTGQVGTIPANELAGKDDRVRVAQLTAIYRQGRISNLASPVIAAIVGYVLLTESAADSIFIWLALVGLASVARGIVHRKFGRNLPADGTVSDSTRRAFLITIFLSGLTWGVGVPMIFPVDNLALQAFLIVVVLGMGAGAMASFGPYFPALAVYVVPLIVPVAAILMFQQTTTHVAFATFGIIFLVVLLLLGSTGHRNFASSVRLEFENAYLALGLEHAQRRLEDAVDSMSEAFALFDSDDRLVLANGQLRELIPELNGRSDADITYREFLQLFAQIGLTGAVPEKIDSWVEGFMRRHRTSGEPFEVEVADGRWLRVTERSTSDDGVVSIFSDLTQLKTREAELAKSEQRFRDFTEAASDWVWELDADLRCTSVSGRYSEITGRSPDFLIGKKLTDYPSLNRDSDWRAVADAIAQRQPFRNRRITRSDTSEEPYQFLFSGVPVFADDGTFVGYRGTGSDITAIARAEALAREARKQLFDAIEAIPAGFVLFDEYGRLILWNSRAPELLPAGSALVRTGTHFEKLVRSSAESGNVIDARDDVDAWIADQMRWYDEPETAREIRFSDGRFIQELGRRTADGGVVAILTDITDIRRDQQELAEKTTLLQATLEGMGEGILVLDRSQCVMLANNQLQQLFGLPPEVTAVGASFADITRHLERDGGSELSGDQGAGRPSVSDQFAAGKPFQFEHMRPSGTRLLVRANPLEDGGWVLLLTNVTAERTAIAALEESEDRYRQLVDYSPDLISVHQDGRFVFVNPAGARLVGVSSPKELIGRRVLDFIHPDHHAYLRASDSTVLANSADGSFFEFRALRDDGTEFEVEGITVEFTYRGGPASLSVVRDITLRKLAQAQLVQTSKLATLGELAAGITHELNQPLNVIRMAADSSLILMEEGKTDREFERNQFARISEQAVRMAKIVSHMGTFSRRQDDDGNRELIDPLECVKDAISLVRDQYAVDEVHIDVELPNSSSLVHGNPVRLEQVILNLLTNAHDALVLDKVDSESGRTFKVETSGRIQISVRYEEHDSIDLESPQSDIVIRIDDNGGGIPTDALDRVFDPFFTTKRTGQGTGLGLAIGYNIVDGMGGRIVASNGPEGARFEVWLPVANDTDIAATIEQSESSGTATGQRF